MGAEFNPFFENFWRYLMSVQAQKSVAPYKLKKGEGYMSPKQLDHFREILNNIKHGLGLYACLAHPPADTTRLNGLRFEYMPIGDKHSAL